jgi:hypothetical protein
MKPQARQPGVAKREVFGWAMYDLCPGHVDHARARRLG